MAEKKRSNDNRRSKLGVWTERLSEYKSEVVKLAILGVPLAVLESLNKLVSDEILSQPWHALAVLIPIAALGALLAQRTARGHSLTIDRRTLLLLGVFILFFSFAAETRVLDWKRDPTLFGQPGARSWLIPVSWGDWRYRLAPKVGGDDVVVVFRDPTAGKTRELARTELVTLMGLARSHGARGVAIDYYFDGESAVDGLVCATVENLGIPVFFGYAFERFQNRLNALPVPPSLQSCVKPDRLGHLVGFLDADRKARIVPLFFNDDRRRPALSLAVSRLLAGDAEVTTPDNGRLQFMEPARPHVQVRLAELLDPSPRNESARNALRDRLVLVAEESESDSFDTPFGRKPGGIVHADAIHSLVHSRYVRDAPWWIRLLPMLAFCYGLAAWCANGAPAGRLVAVGIAGMICFYAIAVLGVVTGSFWFDAVYPTAAVWLLLPLLLTLRRVTGRN